MKKSTVVAIAVIILLVLSLIVYLVLDSVVIQLGLLGFLLLFIYLGIEFEFFNIIIEILTRNEGKQDKSRKNRRKKFMNDTKDNPTLR